MDPTICHICSIQLSSSSNRRRHEKLVHKMVASVDSDSATNESSQDIAVDKSWPQYESNTGYTGSTVMQEETETVSSTMEDELTDTGSSTTEDEDLDSETEQNWVVLLKETFDRINITNADELLKEPLFSEFLEVLRDTLQERLEFASYFENDDDVYKSILNTSYNYLDKDLGQDEAIEKAWDERKFLVRAFFRDNPMLVQRALTEEAKEELEENESEEEIDDEN